MNAITNLSAHQLRQMARLKEKIDSLQRQLRQIIGGAAPASAAASRRPYRIGASARARIIAAQKARWAKFHAAKPGHRPKRKLSAAARAKIAAAARARWAKAKAAGKTRL